MMENEESTCPYESLPKLEPLVGYRIKQTSVGPLRQWLICNGMFMGKWTLHFGSPCLADSYDCKEFLQNTQKDHPELIIVEYSVTPKEAPATET